MSSGVSCVHMPIPKLSNAILSTFQIPPSFYIIPSDLILSQTQRWHSTVSTTNHRTGITGSCLLWCFVSNCVPAPFRTCFQCHLVSENINLWHESLWLAWKPWTVKKGDHMASELCKWCGGKQGMSFRHASCQLTGFLRGHTHRLKAPNRLRRHVWAMMNFSILNKNTWRSCMTIKWFCLNDIILLQTERVS